MNEAHHLYLFIWAKLSCIICKDGWVIPLAKLWIEWKIVRIPVRIRLITEFSTACRWQIKSVHSLWEILENFVNNLLTLLFQFLLLIGQMGFRTPKYHRHAIRIERWTTTNWFFVSFPLKLFSVVNLPNAWVLFTLIKPTREKLANLQILREWLHFLLEKYVCSLFGSMYIWQISSSTDEFLKILCRKTNLLVYLHQFFADLGKILKKKTWKLLERW